MIKTWARNSAVYAIYLAIARAWGASGLKRLLFGETKAGGGLFLRGLNALGAFAAYTSGKCMGVIRKSLLYAAGMGVSGFFRRKLGAAWAASYTGRALSAVLSIGLLPLCLLFLLFITPLVPTKFVLAGGVACAALYVANVFVTGRVRLAFRALDALVMLFTLTIFVSLAHSYNIRASFPMAAVYTLFIILYFAYRGCLNTPARLKAAAGVLLASGALVSLYGVYQKLTGRYIDTAAWIDADMFGEQASRIYATLDNPNVLGEYLLFIIPLAFAALYFVKSWRAKILPLGVLGVSALCMVYTQSRGAWLGLVFGFALFALLHDKRLVALGIIGLAVMPMLLPPAIIERFTSIGDMADSSTSYRVNIWLASLLMIEKFWPCGIGLGTDTFVYIYRLYAFNAVYAPHSHNLFLQLTIDLGIGGLVAFAAMMGVYFKNLLVTSERTRGDPFVKAFACALAAGMAGYLLQGLTDNVWYNYRVVALFWMILALAAALSEGWHHEKGAV